MRYLLEKFGLHKKCLVGQGYNGMASLSGEFKGVQRYITAVSYAIYTINVIYKLLFTHANLLEIIQNIFFRAEKDHSVAYDTATVCAHSLTL
ncbi:zinc finger MYM-type protein 1-like [Aphis craccivora]|uniref:Zinc finger MYM-type protein 1-like n=1 Tax=Aphis craccivora TaxID=307492 RepID=A0A6G0Z973_APHCR|nr:zinc finger MYM-type protein 1-like [Aphis craccivora]